MPAQGSDTTNDENKWTDMDLHGQYGQNDNKTKRTNQSYLFFSG